MHQAVFKALRLVYLTGLEELLISPGAQLIH
jgi:hypothetical protein